MKYFVSAILLFLTLSCSTSDSNNVTCFGGEILNPKSNVVLLLKDNQLIDSISLDRNNRFMSEHVGLEEGLYTFKHGTEFQYIYIEPKDSILVRLNTWDFDESLVFTGKGSSKNEYLINLFLQNEKDHKEMWNHYDLDASAFEVVIDSLINVNVGMYTDFLKSIPNVSAGFDQLANSAIHYPIYNYKENYPYYHKMKLKLKNYPKLSPDFYSFRDNINLNDQNLVSLYPYQNYVLSHLYNLCLSKNNKDGKADDHATIDVLNVIIDQIQLEEFKNTLLKKIVVNDFLKQNSTCSIDEEVLAVFLDNCSNEDSIKQVKNLVNDSQIIVNNEELKDFEITSYNKEITTIAEIIQDHNSVIYFWSTEFMAPDYLVKTVKYLERKFPDILFIGINVQNSYEDIENEPNLKMLDIEKQFKLTSSSYAHTFLTSSYPRTIVVKKDRIVKNGFTYLNSKSLPSQLKKIEKD